MAKYFSIAPVFVSCLIFSKLVWADQDLEKQIPSKNSSVQQFQDDLPRLEKVQSGQQLFAKQYSEILALLDQVMVRNEREAVTDFSHRSRALGRLNQLKNGYVAVKYSTIPMIGYDKTKVGDRDYYQIKSSVVESFHLQPPRRSELFRVDPIEFELVPTIHTERLFMGGEVAFQDIVSMANYKTRLDLAAEVIGFLSELRSLYSFWFNENVVAIINEQDKEDILQAISKLEYLRSVLALKI